MEMMKRFLSVFFGLITIGHLSGQETTLPFDSLFIDEPVELKYEANLDSLLNIYYVNQALEDIVDDFAFLNDTLIPESKNGE